MKVVYIAGPFSADNPWLIELNIREAEKVAYRVAELGASPLCPHSNTGSFKGTLSYEFWIEATIALLRRCDAVLMVNGWGNSRGSVGEHKAAIDLGIPVFYGLEEFASWLEEEKKK